MALFNVSGYFVYKIEEYQGDEVQVMDSYSYKSCYTLLFYKQHLYKQHKAENGLFWNTNISKNDEILTMNI